MKILPEVEIPNAICRFQNYTQSFEWLNLIIWLFAIWGLLHFAFWVFQLIRINYMGEQK